MRISNYYNIEEINFVISENPIFFTSTQDSKYMQQLKLAFLYKFNVYKGNQKNKSALFEEKSKILDLTNTQIRFLPADVYYKRDVEYGTNSILKNVILNIMQYNPKFMEFIQKFYEELNEAFGMNVIEEESNVEINIEVGNIDLNKILSLLDITLFKKDEELNEVEVTEYQLKMLYLKILNMMKVEEEKVYYIIESPEAGLNYCEKIKLIKYLYSLNNVIVFTNDQDILKEIKEIKQLYIIDRPIYNIDYYKFSNYMKELYKNKAIEEIYLKISKKLIDNMEYLLNIKDIKLLDNDKTKNILLNFKEYLKDDIIL